jgi:hypothetical protein
VVPPVASGCSSAARRIRTLPEKEGTRMCKPARYALRFLVVVAIVSLIPMLFTSPSPASSPYVSALSSLAVPQTFAGTKCSYQGCTGGSRYNTVCGKATSATNCQNYKGFCLFSSC